MSIPTSGLVFYAPLKESKATAETGQEFTKTGTVGFSIQENIPCAYFNGSSFLKATDAGLPAGKNPVTISFWAKQFGGNGFFSYGKINQLYSGLWLMLNNDPENKYSGTVNFFGIFYRFGNSALDDKFHHFCIEIIPNEDSGIFYLDGIEQSVSLATNSTPGKSFDDINIQMSGTMEIGSYNDPQEGRKYLDGYLSSFRVYNRTLGKAEIQELANEFNEDSGGSSSGNTGFLIDGLFLSSSKPEQNQKGIIINNNFFIPLIEKGEFDAGVVVDVDGVSKVQPLTFDGLTPSASGSTEDYVAKVYATGMSEPDYIGTVQVGGSTFYKCASVDTSAKTWTGYRAVLNDGIYTFEDIVTTGLFYTSVTPQVGSVYSADALAYAELFTAVIPTDGLVFYASFAGDKATAETGQGLTKSGDITYSMYGNMPCVEMAKEAAVYTTDTADIPYGSKSRTWSFYIKFNSLDSAAYFMGMSDSFYSPGNWYYFFINNSRLCLTGYDDDGSFNTTITTNEWYHLCITYSGKVCSAYVNGSFTSEFITNRDLPASSTYFMMGNTPYHFFNSRAYEGADCCISSVRVYNRVLDNTEIAALANEFTPTQVST